MYHLALGYSLACDRIPIHYRVEELAVNLEAVDSLITA